MIRFHGFIPITIRPAFWLFAALIGFMYSRSVSGTLIWMGIILFSVLFHEFGHAITAVMFGRKPRIEIVALGGVTIHDGQKLSAWKQFFIVLNGPLFGLLLALFAWLALKISLFSTGLMAQILADITIINVFWTVINLLPIMPLDGGQMLRIGMEAAFGAKGFQYALLIGVVIAAMASFALFLFQEFLLGAFFFFFAFQGFEMWRATRDLVDADKEDSLKALFVQAEEAFLVGRKEEAMQSLLSLRIQAKKGMLWKAATQQLALLYYEGGNRKEAYQLLQEVQRDLKDEAACVMHELAFEEENYPLVVSLAPRVFRLMQRGDVALRSAYASAQLKLVKSAIGWLQAAIENENEKDLLQEAVDNSLFDPVREDPKFSKFLKSLKKT